MFFPVQFNHNLKRKENDGFLGFLAKSEKLFDDTSFSFLSNLSTIRNFLKYIYCSWIWTRYLDTGGILIHF